MKIKEAYISNTIDSAKDKIQYDEHVRQILKDKGILAYILKYAVKEFKDYSIDDAKAAIDGEPEVAIRSVRPEAVSTLENESKIPGEGKMYFDILFYAVTNDGYRQKMYINIEAQKSFYPGYDLMDVEYTADNYDGVKKVYSVWICMNAPEKKHSYKKVADSIVEYSIKPTILYPHNATDDEIATGRYDLMSTVFINLNSQNTINSKNVLISMLSTLLSDKIKADEKKQKLEKEYGIKMSKELESEVSSMCNLSEAIEERGIERGRMYTIYDFIQSGMITPEAGAQKLGISVEQLKEDMEAAGYHFPD